MTRPALAQAQIDAFLRDGVLRLDGCLDARVVRDWVAEAFASLGFDPARPATWTLPFHVFPGTRNAHLGELAPRAWEAIGALVGGHERIAEPVTMTLANGFIANFSKGADAPWRGPDPADPTGWHKDSTDKPCFLDSAEQGLLVFALWTDVGPRGGGTFFALDSVAPVARALVEHPEGIAKTSPTLGARLRGCREFLEFTGKAGDVLLVHPYMLHRESQNHSGKARFLTSRMIGLKEPLRFDRPDGGYSPVERAVLRGLEVERLAFARSAV